MYLLLTKVVGEVSHHDLGLGWHTILWWTPLLAWARSGALASLTWVNGGGSLSAWGSGESLVGGLSQRKDLTRNVGWGR